MEVSLEVVDGPHKGRCFAFREHDTFIVGRGERAHFRLPIEDKYFSRHHFLIEINPPRCRLLDLGSTNGTRVNARKVRSAELNDGDLIKGGITTIRVSINSSDSVSTSMTDGDSHRFQPDHFEVIAPERPTATEPEPEQAQLSKVPETAPETSQWPAPRIPPIVGVESPSRASDSTWHPRASQSDVPSCRVCGQSAPGPRAGSDVPVCAQCQDQIRRQDQPIAGYRIVRELGRGGMGVVYLALREDAGDLVALKTIIPEVVVSPKDVQRFLREADILRQLDHPHIVAFRDMGESNGRIFFAMDYVPGTDAARLLHEHAGPLPIPRAVDLVCQMLEALDYAHIGKFVHRDIKPSNLLVRPADGRSFAVLTDFGLARVYQASRMSGLTMTGETAGTLAFMAPEQVTHFRGATPATDLYAAGATLYYLLTGCAILDLPRRMDQALLKILQDDPIPITSRRKDVSPVLARIIHTALAKDPLKRFASAGAMRAALMEKPGKKRPP